MHSLTQLTTRSAAVFALVLLTSGLAAADTISVTPTVTSGAGVFHYDYAIANTTADDVFLIDIPVPASPLAIENLAAPAGFQSAFDSGLGLVSFLEDTATFGSTPLSGFSFDSPLGPGAVSFQATLVSSATGGIYTLSGPTVAPVPEPGYLGLFTVSAAALAIWIRVRRRTV